VNKPFAPASEQNKTVIFGAIREYLGMHVLEVGSGTGQHAVYFAAQRPGMIWQTSDLAENLPGIGAWIESSGLDNLPPPLELDVLCSWPAEQYDTVYSANCFHIMNAQMVSSCIRGAADCLLPGGRLAVYGPFNYAGEYTAPSNARFDQSLKAQNPDSGIKDFEWLDDLARQAGMALLDDIEMPANNRTLIWQKRT
jgi:cyclopropane fatty-acyl-phospholipid synthase-like methyltransferase